MSQAQTKPKPPPISVEKLEAANRALWHGILGRKGWMVEEALNGGADSSAGPDQTILDTYKDANIHAGSLPLTTLFLSHKSWSTSFDTRAMDFKGACRALIIKTRKKHFGERDGMTPIMAYSQVDARKQKHSLCEMILRRTPKEALEYCDAAGRTCLYHFIGSGRTQDVKAAVNAGVDPAHLDQKGCNALHWEYQLRNKRTYKEQKKRDIIEFLLRQKVPVICDNDGNHVLVIDSQIPLSAASGMDINVPGKNGQTLALAALQQFCWGRWKELLADQRTDWMAQIPDIGQFVIERNQRSFSNDKEAAAMYEEIISRRQQLELLQTTPMANAKPKSRF